MCSIILVAVVAVGESLLTKLLFLSTLRAEHHLPGGLVRQPGRVPAAVGGLQLRL